MEDRLFLDKQIMPNDQMISEALGKTYKYWKEVRKSLDNEYDNLIEEWKYYGKNYGWGMKLLLKKRNLFFFAAHNKYFVLGFIFGDKAVSAIKQSDLPEQMITEIKTAKKYAEGTGLSIKVKKRDDIKYIKKLVEIKVNN